MSERVPGVQTPKIEKLLLHFKDFTEDDAVSTIAQVQTTHGWRDATAHFRHSSTPDTVSFSVIDDEGRGELFTSTDGITFTSSRTNQSVEIRFPEIA